MDRGVPNSSTLLYLFTGDSPTLHLPDSLHLLLHLLLLHQSVEVALLQLVLRLQEAASVIRIFAEVK